MNFKYKEKNSFEARKAETVGLRKRYPDRIPVIIEKIPGSSVPDLDRCKFLVPLDSPLSHLMSTIRKRISLPPDMTLCWFVGRKMLSPSVMIATLFQENSDEDGFLYVSYSGENTFG